MTWSSSRSTWNGGKTATADHDHETATADDGTATADHDHDHETAKADDETATADHDHETATADDETATADHDHETATADHDHDHETATADHDHETATADHDHETATADHDHETATADDETATADHDHETARADDKTATADHDHETMKRTIVAVWAALLCSLPAVASAGVGEGPSVGLKVGANWSLLASPEDPAGQPTLMHGTAFDGFGLTVGPSFSSTLAQFGPVSWVFEGDLFYSRHTARGFEEHDRTGARRETNLTTDVLRVPALIKFGLMPGTSSTIFLGFGPELWVGLRSGATVSVENTGEPPDELFTRPVTHLTLNGVVGYDIAASDKIAFPIEVRAAFDPFVQSTTRQRFDGFQSNAGPGEYRVAFNWQILMMTGVRYTGL